MNVVPLQHKPKLRWADDGSKVEASLDGGETWKVIGEFVIQDGVIDFAKRSPWPFAPATTTATGAVG